LWTSEAKTSDAAKAAARDLEKAMAVKPDLFRLVQDSTDSPFFQQFWDTYATTMPEPANAGFSRTRTTCLHPSPYDVGEVPIYHMTSDWNGRERPSCTTETS
jgi:hypothetical protein